MQLYLEVMNDLRKENVRDIRAVINKLDADIYEINERMNKIEDKYLDGEIENDTYNRMINREKQQLKAAEDRKELLEIPRRGKIGP